MTNNNLHAARLFTRTVAALTTAVAALALSVQPAHAWTWSWATHPAGSVNTSGTTPGGDSGGGLYRYHGIYYIPSAGHADYGLGRGVVEKPAPGDTPGQGTIGDVAYTSYAGTFNGYNDVGLIATGSDPIPPKLHVSTGWVDAPITAVAHGNGDLPANAWGSHSGFSAPAAAHNGYRCGQLPAACTNASTICYVYNAAGVVSNGDSGAPVWWYGAAGGVQLIGWVNGGTTSTPYAADGSFTTGFFTPVWTMQAHQWLPSESWSSQGFGPGNDGTGCYVTTAGCVRS